MKCPGDLRANVMPLTFESVSGAWAKGFGRVRGGSLYHLCECIAFSAWLKDRNTKRVAQGLAPDEVHTLKNTGRGTRQSIGAFRVLL